MFIKTHETAKESQKEVPAPGGINSDKDSTNNDQDNEKNPEVLIPKEYWTDEFWDIWGMFFRPNN